VKFSRSAFSSRPPGVYELQLTGHVQDGTPIAGSATLTITGLSKLKKGGGHMTAVRLTGSGAAISFALEADGEVTLDVLDLQGRIVGQVARGFMTAGSYERSWTDANRSAAGLYFLRLRSAESQDVVRLSVYR